MEEDEKALESAFQYAWNWFDLHAKQRMQSMQFFLVISGALAAATGASIEGKAYVVALILSVLITILSILFYLVEKRVKNLVKLSESALLKLEEHISRKTQLSDIRLAHRSDASGETMVTYGKAFGAVFYFFGVAGLAISIFSLIML
jgi:hypothetical protein